MGESRILANGKTGDIGKHLSSGIASCVVRIEDVLQGTARINLKDVDSYLHLAGIVGNAGVSADINLARKININGLRVIAEQFLESGATKFIYVSSGHVYGNTINKAKEDDSLNPQSIYAEQKCEAEEILRLLFSGSSKNLVIARVFSVLDPNMKSHTLGGAVRKIMKGERGIAIGTSDDVRDFLTPKEIAKTLETLSQQREIPQIINICSGKETTIREAVINLLRAHNAEIPLEIFQEGFSLLPRNTGSNKILRSIGA